MISKGKKKRNPPLGVVSKKTRRIAIVFIVIVLIPGLILSLLAIQTASKENAYIEKQMRDSLFPEVQDVTTNIEALLQQIQKDLNDSILVPSSQKDTATTPSSSLVDLPFLLSPKRSILWPLYSAGLSDKAHTFIKFNREFFQDRIPIYVRKKVRASPKKLENIIKYKNPSLKKSKGKKSPTKVDKASIKMKPLNVYYTEVIKEVVDTIESKRFSQLIENKGAGIIPRIVDNEIMLLYWKKLVDNHIKGCVINEEELKRRIKATLPLFRTNIRILTILDHTNTPIFTPEHIEQLDWSEPFVALRISNFLPQWRVAVHLSDPNRIAAQSKFNTIVVGLLIAILFICIITGGLLIIRRLKTEMVLAQQQTTFVANVSHELKTPLTSIRLFAELLKEGRQRDIEKQQNYLTIMVSETERLTRLINNVLDFSQAQSGAKKYSKEAVNAVVLCQDVIESQKVRLEYIGFTVSFTSAIEDAPVLIDLESLKQALLNLMSNAEKYSPHEKKIDLALSKEDSFCIIDVMDKGIGIPKQHLPKIFNKFYRVDESLTTRVQGSGLGLTITKQIIEDHQGTIKYIQREPCGSIFRISLPLVME